MDKQFWENIASCWIKIWSKEDEAETKQNIINIFNDAMSKREEEKSMAERFKEIDLEDLEWLFS